MLGTIEVLKHRKERPLVTVFLYSTWVISQEYKCWSWGNGSLLTGLLIKAEVWS